MIRRLLLPILALTMLVPPGLCECSHEHAARIDSKAQTITETIAVPEPTPVRHHCHHHKQREKPAELPKSEPVSVPELQVPIPDHSHDPFCPAMTPLDIQPPSQQFVVSSDLLLPAAIDTAPWVNSSAVRSHAHDPCRPFGSPPIFISHCALLI